VGIAEKSAVKMGGREKAYTMKIIGKNIPSFFFSPLLIYSKILLLRIRMMEIFKPLFRA